LLPELMTRDDWGFPIVRDAGVPRGLHDHALRAVEVCPVSALKLVPDRSQ
jgi:ferredoxin